MLEMDADASTGAAGKPRRRSGSRSHKRGQGVASQQAVQGLQGIIALGLQGASEVAASASQTPEVALLPGETDSDPGEAEILALLPAQWMAKTQFGREVGKYLISDEHKAVALTLIAYLMRVAPPLWQKAQAADVSRRRNTEPRRSPVSQPTQQRNPGNTGNIIPIGPGVLGSPFPNVPSGGAGASTNGAHPSPDGGVISVPRIGG